MNRGRVVDTIVVVSVTGAAMFALQRVLAARAQQNAGWPSVDETVVERFAKEAGAPHFHWSISWVEGDLLLFAFLCAGLLAGFVMGYYGRAVFGDKGAQE